MVPTFILSFSHHLTCLLFVSFGQISEHSVLTTARIRIGKPLMNYSLSFSSTQPDRHNSLLSSDREAVTEPAATPGVSGAAMETDLSLPFRYLSLAEVFANRWHECAPCAADLRVAQEEGRPTGTEREGDREKKARQRARRGVKQIGLTDVEA